MREILSKRWLAAVPALGLAVAAVVLAAGAFASPAPQSSAQATPRVGTPAPEGLSPVTTTRDWREVQLSSNKRGFR